MPPIPFDNTCAGQLQGFHAPGQPTQASAPKLIPLNTPLAAELNLPIPLESTAQISSGNTPPEGARIIAQAYAGRTAFSRGGDGKAALGPVLREYIIGEAMHALNLLKAVRDSQASLIAQWMSVGFIHGVMNTDNMALSGETIDYGPCPSFIRTKKRLSNEPPRPAASSQIISAPLSSSSASPSPSIPCSSSGNGSYRNGSCRPAA